MVAIVPAGHAKAAVELLSQRGEAAFIIGEVARGTRGVVIQE
jgi:hydrogenase maturation factor